MRQGSRTAAGIATAALATWLISAAPLAAANRQGFALDDFALHTAQDLLDICTLDRSQASYWAAQAFCLGYFHGGADFHRALLSGPGFQPIACPAAGTTVHDAVAVFVTYARAHPEELTKAPMDVVFYAVAERWPCP
jgi:Rap1a immunity proteins